MRIILVSDSHLAPGASAFRDNWRAVRDYVASAEAQWTLHLGDITVDGRDDPGQFGYARALTADWPTPIRYLPGNHDVGDNPPAPGMPARKPLRLDRLADFRATFGPDSWTFDAEGWRLVGVNAQLFDTGTAEEAEQWSWLTSHVADASDMPLILLLHKPLFPSFPLDEQPPYRYVPAIARRRLFDLLSPVELRIVVSGHVHQYLDRPVDDVRHIWLPSTAFYVPDELQDRVGEKVTGLGVLDLVGRNCRFHVICPEGVVRHNILDHPVYPEIVEAWARLASELVRSGPTSRRRVRP